MASPRLWEVTSSPYNSLFLSDTLTFGKNAPIFLIDQFSGKRPILINNDFLQTGALQINFGACALMDSNVVDRMDIFARTGRTTDGFKGFLDFLTKNRWDFNLVFYYLEHFTKSSYDDFFHNAVRRTRSLLTLHTMDEGLYLKTGEVKENPEAVRFYTNGTKGTNLAEVAENRVKEFIQGAKKSLLSMMVEAIEIALIKMVLIRRFEMTRSGPLAQHQELHRFMKEDLDIVLARELHFGIHYFCDNAGKLLGIQKNTEFSKAMANIKSTAWDLFLTRLPDIIPFDVEEGVFLNYMATQEKKLYEITNLFSIEKIVSLDGKIGFPVIGYNMENLKEEVVNCLPKVDIPRIHKFFEKNNIPLGLYESLKKQLFYYLSN